VHAEVKWVLPFVTAVAAVVAASSPSSGASSDTRVVDRTLSCSLALSRGVHKLVVRAQSGTREFSDPSTWHNLAQLELRNPRGFESLGLAGLSAGSPPPGGTWMTPNAARCKPVRSRLALARRGLVQNPASQLGDEYECKVGEKVLVRVRSLYRAPTSLRKIWLDQQHTERLLVANGEITAGYLAARTETGIPLVYAEAFGSGKARLFLAPRCTSA
jgi:hypothetical protein